MISYFKLKIIIFKWLLLINSSIKLKLFRNKKNIIKVLKKIYRFH